MNVVEAFVKSIGVGPVLSREEEAKLILAAQNGSEKAKRQLLQSNIRFIVQAACKGKFASSFLDVEDKLVCGTMGFMHAVEKFNVNSGNKLITYAKHWIEEEIRSNLMNYERAIRIPQNQLKNHTEGLPVCDYSLDAPCGEDSTSFGDLYEDDIYDSPETAWEKKELRSELEYFLDTLTSEESYIIRAYSGYGLDKPLSLRQIAEKVNVSHSTVRNILKKIREQAVEYGLAA